MKPDREEETPEMVPDRIVDHHLICDWRNDTPPEMDREVFVWETEDEDEETIDP